MDDGYADVRRLIGVLESHSAEFGTFHPQTIAVANQLAAAFWRAGNIDQAIGILEQALMGLDSSDEPEHSVRAELLGTLASIFAEQGHWENAGDVYRDLGRGGLLNPEPI